MCALKLCFVLGFFFGNWGAKQHNLPSTLLVCFNCNISSLHMWWWHLLIDCHPVQTKQPNKQIKIRKMKISYYYSLSGRKCQIWSISLRWLKLAIQSLNEKTIWSYKYTQTFFVRWSNQSSFTNISMCNQFSLLTFNCRVEIETAVALPSVVAQLCRKIKRRQTISEIWLTTGHIGVWCI